MISCPWSTEQCAALFKTLNPVQFYVVDTLTSYEALFQAKVLTEIEMTMNPDDLMKAAEKLFTTFEVLKIDIINTPELICSMSILLEVSFLKR